MTKTGKPYSGKLSTIIGGYFALFFLAFSFAGLIWAYITTNLLVGKQLSDTFKQRLSIAENIIFHKEELILYSLRAINGNTSLSEQIYQNKPRNAQKILIDFLNSTEDFPLDILFIAKQDNTVFTDASFPFFNPGLILPQIAEKQISLLARGGIFRFHKNGTDLTIILRAITLTREQTGKVIGALFGGIVINDNMSLLETIRRETQSKAVLLLSDGDFLGATERKEARTTKMMMESKAFQKQWFLPGFQGITYTPEGLLLSYNKIRFHDMPTKIEIVFAIPDKIVTDLRNYYLTKGISFAIGACAFFLLSVLIVRLFTFMPLKSLLNYSDEISVGRMDATYRPGRVVEFNQIGRAMKKMVIGLQEINIQLQKDIAARLQAEKALRENEVHLRTLVETIPDLVWLKDPEGVYLSCNPRFEQFFGAKQADIVGKTDYDFVDKELAELFRQKDKAAIDAGEPLQHEEEIFFASDGHHEYLETVKTPMIGPDGSLVGVLGIARDITDRKKSEKELEEFSRRLAIHVEQTPLGVIEWNLDFKVVQWNQAAEKIFGYTRNQALGRHAATIIIPEIEREYTNKIWNNLLSRNGGSRSENKNITKNGKIVTCEWYNTPLVDHEGVVIGVASLVLDVTERKRAEQEKAFLESQLRQAHKMEAIGTLAGGIAHDFNNILAAILGYADMALNNIPDGNPAKYHIDQILRAGFRAKELVKQILSYSRKEEQERIPIQIQQIVTDTLGLLRASIPATIKIEQSIDSQCGNILANPTQIHQVIMNLCTNSAQSMEEKGGVLKVGLTPVQLGSEDLMDEPHLKAGLFVRLSIKDSGIGIKQQYIEKIFDPYFTTKKIGKGSGMGLSVVIGIVKSHEGMITVDSQIGSGTTFNVYFPRIEEQAQKLFKDTTPLPTGNERILVVDDEEIIVDVTKLSLEHLGYQVTVKTNSKDALKLFRSRPSAFDLVITDQTMPKLTGEQLATALMEIKPDLPIILCSGYSSRMDADKAKKIGINAFIMKPVEIKKLAETIRNALEKHERS